MEDKSFNWFLSECCTRKLRLNILETGICRGSLLLDWFQTDQYGVVVRKPKKDTTRTKHLLSYYLNQRHPVLEEYNPDKVICYLYHKTGVKVVTSKDSIELAENQLHGLQVRSIHMALASSLNFYKAFRLHAWSEGGELCHKLTHGRIAKEMTEEVTDGVMYEKVLSIFIYISDALAKNQFKNISTIKLDLVTDSAGAVYIVKVVELVLDDSFTKSEAIIRNLARRPSLRQYDESSEEEISNEDIEGIQNEMKFLQELRKKNTSDFKMPLKKRSAPNSVMFLEMVAKTIDRERKVQEFNEMIKNKKMMLENNHASNHKKVFQMRSMKHTRENIPKKHAIKTINELLYYVEKTRPRIWLKDVVEDTKAHEVQVESMTTKSRYNKTSECKTRPKKSLPSHVMSPKMSYDRSVQLIIEKLGHTHSSHGFNSTNTQTPLNAQALAKSKQGSPRQRQRSHYSNKSLKILPIFNLP